MNLYVIYQGGIVISVTTLPRIAIDELHKGADTVEVWRKEQRVQTFQSAREFARFINPRPGEDDEEGSNNFDW